MHGYATLCRCLHDSCFLVCICIYGMIRFPSNFFLFVQFEILSICSFLNSTGGFNNIYYLMRPGQPENSNNLTCCSRERCWHSFCVCFEAFTIKTNFLVSSSASQRSQGALDAESRRRTALFNQRRSIFIIMRSLLRPRWLRLILDMCVVCFPRFFLTFYNVFGVVLALISKYFLTLVQNTRKY